MVSTTRLYRWSELPQIEKRFVGSGRQNFIQYRCCRLCLIVPFHYHNGDRGVQLCLRCRRNHRSRCCRDSSPQCRLGSPSSTSSGLANLGLGEHFSQQLCGRPRVSEQIFSGVFFGVPKLGRSLGPGCHRLNMCLRLRKRMQEQKIAFEIWRMIYRLSLVFTAFIRCCWILGIRVIRLKMGGCSQKCLVGALTIDWWWLSRLSSIVRTGWWVLSYIVCYEALIMLRVGALTISSRLPAP